MKFFALTVSLAVLAFAVPADLQQVLTAINLSVSPPVPPRLSTYFGYALGMTDSADQAGPGPITITPPSNMKSGDLVVVSGVYRGNNTPISVTNAGGQAWDSLTYLAQTLNSMRAFWCKFNGTWSTNPTFGISSGTNALTVFMHVFRPADTSAHSWAIDSSRGSTYSAPSTPFDVTINGVTASVDSTVVYAVITSSDDNSWLCQTGGWTNGQPYSGLQNINGSDNSMHCAYKFQQTKGATGSVVERQTNRGGDPGAHYIIVFR